MASASHKMPAADKDTKIQADFIEHIAKRDRLDLDDPVVRQRLENMAMVLVDVKRPV